MKPTDLLQLLEQFFREKAALRDRHVAAARAVGQYDFNNTYQYVIAREDQHLEWIADAIRELGGSVPESRPLPEQPTAKAIEAQRQLMGENGRTLEAFVTDWRQRVAPVTNARHKLMLELILGEVLEEARFFQQAANGRVDLLGRRTGGQRTEGAVLPTRWVE